VEVGRFVSKKHRGVSFRAESGGRVRARTTALPDAFGRATKAKIRLSVRDASAAHPVLVRFEFFDAAGAVRWSQPVTFTDARWKTVTLRFPGANEPAMALLSPMQDVSSWGMSFAGDSDVRVQEFELWRHGAPELPQLARDALGLFVSEPPSMKASRSVSEAWLRGESPVRLDAAFDGIVSMHRMMAARFPVPDPDAETPMTVSVIGGMQTAWSLAQEALGRASKVPKRKRDTPYPVPEPVPLPSPWIGLPL
jgi:hypothetical protein